MFILGYRICLVISTRLGATTEASGGSRFTGRPGGVGRVEEKSRRQPREEVQYYMSHSSQPREPSSIPSPRPLQAKPASNPTAASRPGTASTSNVESLKSYASIPPFGISDPSRQQPDFSQIPSESAAQPQPRGFSVLRDGWVDMPLTIPVSCRMSFVAVQTFRPHTRRTIPTLIFARAVATSCSFFA
jgi:hypothetical protein